MRRVVDHRDVESESNDIQEVPPARPPRVDGPAAAVGHTEDHVFHTIGADTDGFPEIISSTGGKQPEGDVFDPEVLSVYVRAAKRVAPHVTGFPIVFLHVTERITSGFYWAVALGSILVLIILLIDYRDLRDVVFAAIPLAMGVVWMMGFMGLAGLSFNFANLVAIPLIIGVGIDNGVHIVHRVRLEGAEGMSVVLRHTGRAILIASLTTMIGFGSLGLASHQGLASLGKVLLLGGGSCLVTSTLVLPNILVALGKTRR